MLTLNTLAKNILDDTRSTQKIIIGGLLMFIPIVNFFALGYLSRYAAQVLRTGSAKLPEWENWGRMFIGGIWFFLVILVYGVLPLLGGWVLSEFLDIITVEKLGWFPYFPLSFACLVSPTLIMIGLFAIREKEGFEGLFSNILGRVRLALSCWKLLLMENFAFLGLVIVGLPLYGLSFFLGMLLLIPYTALVFADVGETEE